ncbi:MAG: hypothetical protein KAG80_10030 [Nocardioides sp.]|nr:hypothetical protein [Nocardioides sp.]
MVKSDTDPWGQMLSVAAIGSFVINFGHLEHSMMRLLEWLQGSRSPGVIEASTLRLTWSQLVDRVRSAAEGSTVEEDVRVLLREHHVELLASLRHSLVHGSVGVGEPPTVAINRRTRDGQKSILIGTRDEIERECRHVIDLGAALDRLLPETFRRVESNLIAGVVGMTTESAHAQGLDPTVHIDEQRRPAVYDLQDEV